jgi:hypothetical protein
MRLLCTLTIDLTNLEKIIKQGQGRGGKMYYHFPFEVALKFGGTSLQAKLLWSEDVSGSTSVSVPALARVYDILMNSPVCVIIS